jgi:predicted carbohydrate-binding protein with CBM5 and CBM33 domain
MDMGGELLEGREREEKTNGFGIISKDAANSDKYGRQEQYRNMGEENGINEGQGNEFICNAIKRSSEDGNVADTDSNGFHKRNGNDEINASERGINALNDINQSNGIGNIADTESQRTWEQSSENRGREDGRFNNISEDGDAAYPKSKRLQRGFNNGKSSKWIQSKFTEYNNFYEFKNWQNFPTQSPVCGGDDGISHGLDNITFSKWRNESIKGYGNAVVPQVVYRIFKTIEYIQNLKQ